MKYFILALTALLLIPSFTKAQDEKRTTYGKNFEIANVVEAASLPKLLDDKSEITNIVAKGKITAVCKMMGCWMKVDAGNGQEVMIKFGDHDFTLPKDSDGKTAYFTGTLFKKITSVKELKHLAEDGGKSKEEIDSITEPKEEIRFNATGVILIG